MTLSVACPSDSPFGMLISIPSVFVIPIADRSPCRWVDSINEQVNLQGPEKDRAIQGRCHGDGSTRAILGYLGFTICELNTVTNTIVIDQRNRRIITGGVSIRRGIAYNGIDRDYKNRTPQLHSV